MIKPPMMGPRAMPMPFKPAQTPMALPRSARGKTLVIIAKVAGRIMAPPTPITARHMINCQAVSAKAAAALAPAKTTMPSGPGPSGQPASPWSA